MGTYTVTYNAIDASGNVAAEVTRTVIVEQSIDPILEVSSINEFSIPGGIQSVNVTSNVSWIATTDSEWLVVNEPSTGDGNGNFSISAPENFESVIREADLVLTGIGISKTIRVTQKSAEVLLELSELEVYEFSGGQQELIITASCDWEISYDADWLVLDQESGSKNQIILVSALENTSRRNRTTTLLIRGGLSLIHI